MNPAGRGRTLLLVGLMGSGKTTVARLVGEATGRAVLDTDEMVEEAAGMPVRGIIESLGEAEFRAREGAALAEALTRSDAVVAAAGGSVCSPGAGELVNARRAAGECTVVWLTASVPELARRTRVGAHRPALDGGAESALARMETERREVYAGLADVVVDTDGRDAAEVARAIVRVTQEGAVADAG